MAIKFMKPACYIAMLARLTAIFCNGRDNSTNRGSLADTSSLVFTSAALSAPAAVKAGHFDQRAAVEAGD
jgi:hypothetical protein